VAPVQPVLHAHDPSPPRPSLQIPCWQLQAAQSPPKWSAAHVSQLLPVQPVPHVSQLVPVQPVPAAHELHFPSPVDPSLHTPWAQVHARQLAP
jgi:hypothetical protein